MRSHRKLSRKLAHEQLAIRPDSSIVARLFRKKELLERNDPEHAKIRTLLIVLGGGLRGVSGGGAVVALDSLGLNKVFDIAIGASAGSPNTAYFLTGEEKVRIGTSIYYDELRGRRFINLWRLTEIANIDWLGKTFAEGEKKLDVATVLSHRTKFMIALTDYIDGSTNLFDVKDYPDGVVRMVQISCAIPFLYRRPLRFDGRRYVDGSVAFSVRRTLESSFITSFAPTDVVVITNTEETDVPTGGGDAIEWLAAVFSHHFERLLLRRIQLADDLEYLAARAGHGVNIGVIGSPPIESSVGNLTTDPMRLWHLGDATLQYVLRSFGKPELYKPLILPKDENLVGSP